MARKTARPGRTLVVFFLGLAISYGLVALAGTWKPALGLDLQGGTRITLTALDDPSAENLELARQIIDDRVNGSGVAEAEVTTESGRFIVVEIPGSSRRDLIETVQRQAQLRFRLVACSDLQPCGGAAATAPGAAPESPGAAGESGAPTQQPSGEPTQGANRAPVTYADETESPSPTASPSASPSATPADSAAPTGDAEPIQPPEGGPNAGQPLAWMDNPNPEAVTAFNQFTCPPDGTPVNVVDDPDKPLVTCQFNEQAGGPIKYLLSPAVIEGTSLTDASAGIPQNQVRWAVDLELGGDARRVFADVSRALVNTDKQFAIVLDGQVISAPTMEGVITNGRAQITGDFRQAEAESLANSLKFGALPIAFDRDSSVETVGPSLAGNQLRAGLTAGALGLGLVMLYCLFYYRALGIVVLMSLLVAAAATYSAVLLLSKTAGFTLTLPGIAGLIIAVGITADSFIIFFERIRDEMREGKSMRVAVESGWVRARVTRLAANTVSILSALVLYIFATGVVKGFGFALGLSTLIDLAVLFWFTKPMVSFLARYKLFNGGGKLSGLSEETLGMDQHAEPVTVGGRA